MAKKKGNPNPKNQFQKGNKAGVGHGRPSLTEEEKKLSIATRTEFKTVLMKYSSWTREEIKNALESKSLPIMHEIILKHLLEGLESGSMQRVDWTLDHIMGKPKEVSHVKVHAVTENQIDPRKLSKEDLLALKEIHEKAGKNKQ